ncbi:peptide deformylase [Alkalicoccus daliensis]|uniref:Peptide deformylase n=1 Tax=Alkalicoccus daliensis TaxID=745820 RepID=A0A1G9ZP34_9BACI|nr:peptide deformylase [Alkalicoccus daliensis]SDN23292.1 peptide deformylase [Alkalicoccus daliensis]
MITMKDIIREGHPTLRKKAEQVELPLSDKNLKTLHSMMEFLRNSQDPEKAEELELRPGVGLAAPQINVSKQIIAVRTFNDNDEPKELLLINPKLVSHSQETAYLESGEGCLSVDRPVEGIVPRYARIKVEAYNEHEEKNIFRFRGYEAIVVQHELDHLNGIMFYDRIEDYEDDLKQALPAQSVIPRSENETII